MKSVLNIHWKEWCWSWNSNPLATWCKELTHLKRPWCWIILKVGGEGNDRGWDGWMASPTQWTWVWVSSGSGWWTGKPGMLQSMGWQRVRHNWVTELNWTEPVQSQLVPKHIRLPMATGTTVLPNTYHLPTALSWKSEPRNLPTQRVTYSIR